MGAEREGKVGRGRGVPGVGVGEFGVWGAEGGGDAIQVEVFLLDGQVDLVHRR